MIEVSVEKKLGQAIRTGKVNLGKILQASTMLVEREYKIEAPVNDGLLRNSIKTVQKSELEYTITTTAQQGGFPYPIAVHEGTGKYKGTSDRGRGNWSRMAGYTPEDIAFFKMLAKRRAISQKPNKFAERAEKTAKPNVIKFISRELNNELHKD